MPAAQQIVARMTERNQERSERLRHYVSRRHYHVEYHGFPSSTTASMDVEVTYDAPSTKTFRIQSQSGSKLLINHVLRKLLESEQEAARDPAKTALTPANYKFELLGKEDVAGRSSYLLHVEPRVASKFLYRGKIWIDAADSAVSRIEAEPAKNPSFWIQKTAIEHIYAKFGEFWLPKRNRSETRARVGGTAVLTIEYTSYDFGPPAPVR